MRINNPPQQAVATVQVSGVASPQIITTFNTVTLTNATSTDIAPLTDQIEALITNVSTVGTVFVRDTAGTAGNIGTPIPPQATAVFTINKALRVTNNSGSSVTITGNQTAKGP